MVYIKFSEIGSSNTQDLGGDIFTHGVITSIERSLFEKFDGETNPHSRVFLISIATESESLLGLGFIATPSRRSSFVSREIEKSDGSPTMVLEVILPRTDLDVSSCLDDNAFDLGRGVSRNSCLPLSTVQSARQETRGEGETSESNLVGSGLLTTLLSSSVTAGTISLAKDCPN